MSENKHMQQAVKPATFLIVMGVIKGYVKRPYGFMLGTIASFPSFMKRCPSKYSKDFLREAGFTLHLYERLQKKVPKEKAFEITRATLLTASMAVIQANFRNVEAPRNFDNLVKYQQETNRTGSTKDNTFEVVEKTDKTYQFKITRCVFDEFFTEMGAKELTAIMCSVDNAIFNTYLPNELVFHRQKGHTLTEGYSHCEFCVEKV